MITLQFRLPREDVDHFVDLVQMNDFQTEVTGNGDGPMVVSVLVDEASLVPQIADTRQAS